MAVSDRAANIYYNGPMYNTHFFDKFAVYRDISENQSAFMDPYKQNAVVEKK